MSLGKSLSSILSEIEDTLLENNGIKPNFTNEGFRAGIYIFKSVVLDKMFELQNDENISIEIRSDMAKKCGEEIRGLIKKYCNIDTHELYK